MTKGNKVIIESFKKEEQEMYIIKPNNNSQLSLTDLLEYVQDYQQEIRTLLLRSGAILFRGFDVIEKNDFLKVKELFSKDSKFDYVDGNSPRVKLAPGVYTSTEYPKEYSISLHNELSYTNKWPKLIFFFCKTPAEEGGETPIIDCRFLLKALGNELSDGFQRHGVKYTRYLSGNKGVGKSWMDTFETNDKMVVEAHCRQNNIDFSWENNNLFLSQIGLGIAEHPLTGEKVWFNQANQFHPSNLPDDIYKMLKILHTKKKESFPQYAYYGNGEEISEDDLRKITAIQFNHALKFTWQKSDLLLLDNMLMAHGRMPFSGDRKIYVSMC